METSARANGKDLIGYRVVIMCKNPTFDGKFGTITNFLPNNALPIAVTLDGETHETDFGDYEVLIRGKVV